MNKRARLLTLALRGVAGSAYRIAKGATEHKDSLQQQLLRAETTSSDASKEQKQELEQQQQQGTR